VSGLSLKKENGIIEHLGDRNMIESLTGWEFRKVDSGDEDFLTHKPYCISTKGGLTMCGKTAYRLLHHLRFKFLYENERDMICPKCLRAAWYAEGVVSGGE
jgi:hypothetical protein